MATELEKLVLRVEAQTKAARQEMAKMSKDVRRSNNNMQRSFRRTEAAMKRMGRTGARLRGQLMTLVPAVTLGAFAALTSRALKSADALVKTADKVGLTTGQLQELQFAASQSGVGTQTLNMAMQRFSRRMGEAAIGTGEALKTVKQYGVELRNADGTMKSNVELLRIWADKIKNATTQQERLRIAFKLFDSEGAALVNMMRNGAAGIDAFAQQARSLGLVIDDQLLRRAEQVNDQFDILNRVIGAEFKRAILEIGPDLQNLAKWMTEAFVNSVKDAKKFIDATRKEFEFLGDAWAATVVGIETEASAVWDTLVAGVQSAGSLAEAAFLGMASVVLQGVELAVRGIISLVNAAIKALVSFATGPIATIGQAVSVFDKEAGAKILALRKAMVDQAKIKPPKSIYKQIRQDATDALAAAKNYKKAGEIAHKRMGTGYDAGMRVFRQRQTTRHQTRQAQAMRGSFGLPYQRTQQTGTGTPPPGTGTGGGRKKATDDVKKHDEALKKLNLTLDQEMAKIQLERQTLGQSSAQRTALMETQRQVQQLQRQGITLTAQETEKLREKNLAIAQAREATDQLKQAYEQIRTTLVSGVQQGFDSVIDALFEGKNAMEAFKNSVKNLAKQLVQLFFRLAVVNPLLNALGLGGKGGLPSFFSFGKFADGGRPPVGVPSIVGERGPEMFIPDTQGTIVPNHKMRNMGSGATGPVIYADLRGADVAAVAKLEKMVYRIDATFEKRAVGGVVAATASGGVANKVLGR